jgi:ubiquinone/menaquinone biosynthesis C-methylase UbiE
MSKVVTRPDYVLGHSTKELERLDRQGADLAGMTRQALQLAGVRAGMRVLDMGTGTGQVARVAAEMVGPEGAVTAVDASADALAWAAEVCHGGAPITYVEGDVSSYTPAEQMDAVLARLVLPYQSDPVRVAQHWLDCLRPGGVLLCLEYDTSVAGSVPSVPLVAEATDRLERAFAAVGQAQSVGPRLARILRSAGAIDPQVIGLQRYVEPGDPTAAAMVADVSRTLLPVMVQSGIATADEVDVDTLQARLEAAAREYDAMMRIPTLVAGWCRR